MRLMRAEADIYLTLHNAVTVCVYLSVVLAIAELSLCEHSNLHGSHLMRLWA